MPDGSEGRRVLVVDDDDGIRRLVRVVLELEGWKVREAGDGAVALILARSDPPDALVLDVMLPGRDGFDVLAELRQSDHGRDMAVVMLTAMSQPSDIARGGHLGVDEYLTKPFDPSTLAERLAFHVRSHRASLGGD